MKNTNLRTLMLASLVILGVMILGLVGMTRSIAKYDFNIEPVALAQDDAAQGSDLNAGQPITTKAQGVQSVNGNCFAVVNTNGTTARGNCLISTKRLAAGTYEIIFNGSVRQCTYLATIGLTGSSGAPPPGEIGVVGRVTDARGVYLQTRASNGTLADRPFHLGVFCR
jgi:hypothetical protein